MENDTTNKKIRTGTQNRALHKYLTMVSDELSNQGQTMQNITQKLTMIEITPTMEGMKEIWRAIQKSMFRKKSTAELTTKEINAVYDVMSMWLAKNFEISLPFPNVEDTDNYLKSYER